MQHLTLSLTLLCILIQLTYPLKLLSAEMAAFAVTTKLRQRADVDSNALWQYSAGFPIRILKRKGEWYFVKDFENDTGWVHNPKLSKNSHVIVKANKSEEQSANIRASPSLDAPVVANAFYGVVFSLLEKKAGWVKVQHDSGVIGWIKQELIWGIE